MRQDYSSGKYSYRTLVKKYNMSQTQVARILKKESWEWV
jgi:Mor family transcriptional regulator